MKFNGQLGNASADAFDGDVNTGTDGSIYPAAACNQGQKELLAVIAGLAGKTITPRDDDLGQVLEAILAAAMPAGTLRLLLCKNTPPRHLLCDGKIVIEGDRDANGNSYERLFDAAAFEIYPDSYAMEAAAGWGVYSYRGVRHFRTPNYSQGYAIVAGGTARVTLGKAQGTKGLGDSTEGHSLAEDENAAHLHLSNIPLVGGQGAFQWATGHQLSRGREKTTVSGEGDYHDHPLDVRRANLRAFIIY